MKLTNKDNVEKYLKEGEDFVRNTKAPFSDVRTVVKLGITEYLANKDGYTIYESVADEK